MTSKFTLTLFGLVLFLLSAQAQLQDISMGVSYGNQAYYSLDSDEVTQIKNESWDIAFSKYLGQEGGIFVNESVTSGGVGIEFYLAPTNNWDDPIEDISIYDDILPLLNDEASWYEGAFNHIKAENDDTDYGWGVYDSGNDVISGTEVFLMKNRAAEWSKLQIVSLEQGVYTLRTAQLDGSEETIFEIATTDYPDANVIHYSFATNEIIDVPQEYDFSMQRFINPVATNTGELFEYPVTGVLLAPGTQAVSIDSVETDQVSFSDYEDQLTERLDVIGHDWKYFDFNSGWVVDFDRANFVKTRNDDVYKVLLVDFAGSFSGNTTIEKTLITTVKVENSLAESIQVFPNPVSDYFVIKSDSEEVMQLAIYSIDGQRIKNLTTQNGALINVNSMQSGIYVLQIIQGGNQWTQRLTIR